MALSDRKATDNPKTYKAILIGPPNAGKTSLLKVLANPSLLGEENLNPYQASTQLTTATIKTTNSDLKEFPLTLMDIPGDKSFLQTAENHIRGTNEIPAADMILFVIDGNDAVKQLDYFNLLKQALDQNTTATRFLISNKLDKGNQDNQYLARIEFKKNFRITNTTQFCSIKSGHNLMQGNQNKRKQLNRPTNLTDVLGDEISDLEKARARPVAIAANSLPLEKTIDSKEAPLNSALPTVSSFWSDCCDVLFSCCKVAPQNKPDHSQPLLSPASMKRD